MAASEFTGLLRHVRRGGSGAEDGGGDKTDDETLFVVLKTGSSPVSFLFALPRNMHRVAPPVPVSHPLFAVELAPGRVAVQLVRDHDTAFVLREKGEEDVLFVADSAEQMQRWVSRLRRALARPDIVSLVDELELRKPQTRCISLSADDPWDPVRVGEAATAVSALDEGEFLSLERIKELPFDKAVVFAQVERLRQATEDIQRGDALAARAADVEELRKHKAVLVREVKALRSEAKIVERALASAQTELKRCTKEAERESLRALHVQQACSDLADALEALPSEGATEEELARVQSRKEALLAECRDQTVAGVLQGLGQVVDDTLAAKAEANTFLTSILKMTQQKLRQFEELGVEGTTIVSSSTTKDNTAAEIAKVAASAPPADTHASVSLLDKR